MMHPARSLDATLPVDTLAADGVLPAAALDVRDGKQLEALREQLLHWSESDTERFGRQVREFMLAAGVPALPVGSAGATTVSSFINGAPMYALADTTPEEYQALFARATRSAALWNALPLAGRQAFFRILAREINPAYRKAVDLAITLEVGKAGSEFDKTTNWDSWGASAQVGSYLSGVFIKDDQGRKYYLDQTDRIPETEKNLYFYQGARAEGLGVTASTNGFNYPAALAIPDIVCSRVSGNAYIGKVPAKSPSFLFIRKRAEEEALDLLSSRRHTYRWYAEAVKQGVDIGNESTLQALKDGFAIISGRHVIESWAKDAATLRIVGGRSAGQTFARYRAGVDPHMERTILELAGNNPVVIMPSAANLPGGLKKVVNTLAEGNKNNSGQRCTSPRRWLVHRDIYPQVEALAVASYQATANNSNGAIGNPLNPATKVGAMDKGGFDAAQDYLAAARAAGARVIGGERLFADRFPNARYMAPALVLWHGVAAEKKRIMHEQEIFAPVANLDCVDSLEEAIHATNESTEHLSGGFYCDNAHIHELVAFIHGTHLGSLIHNGAPKDLSPEGVHAGRNEGGVGITGSLRGLDQYTRREPPNTIRLLAKVESLEAAHALAQALQEL